MLVIIGALLLIINTYRSHCKELGHALVFKVRLYLVLLKYMHIYRTDIYILSINNRWIASIVAEILILCVNSSHLFTILVWRHCIKTCHCGLLKCE